MDKEHIINEIKRAAKENGGKPLGIERFEAETGIKKWDWYGKYWTKWGDALEEAGFEQNSFNQSYDKDYLIGKYVELILEINKFPTSGEIRYKATNDKTFPSHNTFEKLGNKEERAQKIIEYCIKNGKSQEIIDICRPICHKSNDVAISEGEVDRKKEKYGFVYLMKSGKYYKIGRSNSTGRRHYELGIQLPDKLEFIHEISTDDPEGIEGYWHKRFADKRKNGEWFELTSLDIKSFKRRKFM